MPKILPPCGDCERAGCGDYHDQCEAYAEYRKAIAAEKAARHKEAVKMAQPVQNRKRRTKWKSR